MRNGFYFRKEGKIPPLRRAGVVVLNAMKIVFYLTYSLSIQN